MTGFPILPGLWAHHAVQQAKSADRTAERAASRAESVDQRLERALLTMEAIWSLVRERFQLNDEDLARRIVELDESDGLLDGKVRRQARTCPHCQKTIPGRFPRCLYCGGDVMPDPFA